MKTVFIFTLFLLSHASLAQLGVSFHQSSLPFVGINYQFKSKIRTELRLGTDFFFDRTPVEGVIVYNVLKNEDYEFYAGVGGRVNSLEGLVIPVGVNLYPLPKKQFGFHIELAPIIGDMELLRGSWGIRYRFAKE